MEPEQTPIEIEQEDKFTNLKKVTPLSKYLAMVLFVVLPFIGGWIGYTFAPEKAVEVERVVVNEVKSPNISDLSEGHSNISNDSYDTTTLYEYRDPRTGISFRYPKGVDVKVDQGLNGSFGGFTIRTLDGSRRQVATKITLRAAEPGVFDTSFTTRDYKSAISQLRHLPSEGEEAEDISPTIVAGLRSIGYRIKGKTWEDYSGYYRRVLTETSSSTFLIIDHYLEPQCANCESERLPEVQKIIEDTLEIIHKVEVVPDSLMERVKEDARQRGVRVADEIQPKYIYTHLSADSEVYAHVSPATENYAFTVRGYTDGLVQPVSEGLSAGPKVVEIMYVVRPDGELIVAHEIDGNIDQCIPWDPPYNCTTDYECGCKRYFDVKYDGFNFSPNGKYMIYAVSKTSGFMDKHSFYLYDIVNSNLSSIPYVTASGIETRFDSMHWVPNKDDFDLVIIGRYDSGGMVVGAGGYSGVFIVTNDNLGELELIYTYEDGHKDGFDPHVTEIEDGLLWFEQDDQHYRIDIEKGLVEETGGQQ